MVWLSDRENKSKDMITRFDTIHELDGQTDGRTDTAQRHRPRLCRAACSNKCTVVTLTNYSSEALYCADAEIPQETGCSTAQPTA